MLIYKIRLDADGCTPQKAFSQLHPCASTETRIPEEALQAPFDVEKECVVYFRHVQTSLEYAKQTFSEVAPLGCHTPEKDGHTV
jgi:hypothetical protein